MKEHYTKNTVEARAWCNKCDRATMHRVDRGRLGSCLDCIERLDKLSKALQEQRTLEGIQPEQIGLFNGN